MMQAYLVCRFLHQIAGQSPVGIRVDQKHDLTIAHIGDRSQRGLEPVHGKSDMPAVEITAHQHLAVSRIENRIIVGTVGISAEITLPDGSRRREELLEVVGMRVSSFGKWLSRWRPGGALDQDYLQLITLKPSGRLAMFRYAISAIFRGAGPESKSRSARVEFVRALCVRFRVIDPGPTARLRAQADGEVMSGMPAEMSIVPHALTLLMPPSQ